MCGVKIYLNENNLEVNEIEKRFIKKMFFFLDNVA